MSEHDQILVDLARTEKAVRDKGMAEHVRTLEMAAARITTQQHTIESLRRSLNAARNRSAA